MRKYKNIIVALVLATVLFTACQSAPAPASSASPSNSGTSPSASAPSASAGTLKTGLAVITGLSKSNDADGANGIAQVDSTIAAVAVDKDGKIQNCVLDAIEAQVVFDGAGKFITPTTSVFKTKTELADAYGLKKYSGIGKEWYEQAAAFSKYVVGKTADEVKAIKVDDSNHATQADLKASVDIPIGWFVAAIDKAVKNAQNSSAGISDRLCIGSVTNMAKSYEATAEKTGLAQVESTYAAVTRDAVGKITSCVIDGTESKLGFNGTGKITTDLSLSPLTKNTIQKAAAQKKDEGSGKEWSDQAAAFAKYCVGKTAAEIAGIAVDDNQHAVAADLKATVTISVGDFKAAIAKAASSQ